MSYTVTPNISYGPNGEEIVSYKDAYIDDGAYRQHVRENFNRDNSWQDDLYYETPDGQIRHRYGDLDGEIYQRYEQDYVDGDIDADDYLKSVQYIGDEDYQSYTAIVGGPQSYDEMLEWASRNTNSDYINWFDEQIESGDSDLIVAAIQDLYEAWSTRRYEDDGDDYVGYIDDDDDVYEEDDSYDSDVIEATPQFLQAVEDNYPDYGAATQWAFDYLDEDVVSRYDNIMDYGSLQEKAEAIDQLMDLYRTHN
jgi:hypothetical protein